MDAEYKIKDVMDELEKCVIGKPENNKVVIPSTMYQFLKESGKIDEESIIKNFSPLIDGMKLIKSEPFNKI